MWCVAGKPLYAENRSVSPVVVELCVASDEVVMDEGWTIFSNPSALCVARNPIYYTILFVDTKLRRVARRDEAPTYG